MKNKEIRINYKIATYVSLIVIITINTFYLTSATEFIARFSDNTIGPEYFPKILSYLLYFFCVVSLIQNFFKKKTEYITINNPTRLMAIIFMIIIFLILWAFLELFYPLSIIFMFLLFYTINPSRKKNIKKALISSFVMSFITNLVIYILFNVLMSFNI